MVNVNPIIDQAAGVIGISVDGKGGVTAMWKQWGAPHHPAVPQTPAPPPQKSASPSLSFTDTDPTLPRQTYSLSPSQKSATPSHESTVTLLKSSTASVEATPTPEPACPWPKIFRLVLGCLTMLLRF